MVVFAGTLRRRPIEPVLLPRLADDTFGICSDACARAILLGVIVLRVNIGKKGLNRAKFVLADAASENLPTAGSCVEAPDSILADERNRKRETPCPMARMALLSPSIASWCFAS